MSERAIGIIGGSGLYGMEGLEDVRELEVATPFGTPSDKVVTGNYGGRKLVFLPRHGRGHRFLPSEVPYRANIWALKSLGVEWIVSISAVGSLAEELKPGDICLPDQFVDRTWGRQSTFFGNGIVGHVGFGEPICPVLAGHLMDTAPGLEAKFHKGGAYVCMQGPQFSTKAESHSYRALGAKVIGMTNATEAKLAREAEICYATVALVTDYDCWHETEEAVTVEAIIAVLNKNVATAKEIIRRVASKVGFERDCACPSAARYAIMTAPNLVPPQTRRDVDLLFGKYLKD